MDVTSGDVKSPPLQVNKRGLPIILISHNMPNVFEVARRIQIMRLSRRIPVMDPRDYSMADAVCSHR